MPILLYFRSMEIIEESARTSAMPVDQLIHIPPGSWYSTSGVSTP